MTTDHAAEARAALELADTYREDGAFQSAERCQRDATRHLLWGVLEQLPSSQLIAETERLQQVLARLTEQSDLWHRGDLDTTTAMAGVYGELHGMPLPEVGEWDRARVVEQAARDKAAAEAAVGHCPPHLRFPCGHCAHDLCQDCSRCCTCKCPNPEDCTP